METYDLQLLVEQQNENILALTVEKEWLADNNINLQEQLVELQQNYNKKIICLIFELFFVKKYLLVGAFGMLVCVCMLHQSD